MFSPLIAVPSYNGQVCHELFTALQTPFFDKSRKPSIAFSSSSLLAFGFNQLWCLAINNRHLFTHFLMVHADIIPEKGFADVLLAEMNAIKADIISVVSPIKNTDGFTSTAIELDGTAMYYTMGDVHALPKTFSTPNLLLNTGCMLISLQNSKVDELVFQVRDRIIQHNGKYEAQVMPEDWDFSRQARRLKMKLAATRAVTLSHVGSAHFRNDTVWGEAKPGKVAPVF